LKSVELFIQHRLVAGNVVHEQHRDEGGDSDEEGQGLTSVKLRFKVQSLGFKVRA